VKLFVGLGNPGRVYASTRHNIGFTVVKSLAAHIDTDLKREAPLFASIGAGSLAGERIIIAQPLTYMNLSGLAVRALLKRYNCDAADMLVVCDDLDLEFGRLRLRLLGSSGGHRGLTSIIEALGTNVFCRLRIGIGRPAGNVDPAEYVLSSFEEDERVQLRTVIDQSIHCCESWVLQGPAETMNVFNKMKL
jgi:peptidyl-tRNA hydrolase, PTH1 family